MTLTPGQRKSYARELMKSRAKNPAQRGDAGDGWQGMSPHSLNDNDLIAELIETATVTITWPDPCPACGVVGCTEHPTWAAESEPEHPYVAARFYREPADGVIPEPGRTPLAWHTRVGLAPVQVIRLELVRGLINERTEVDEPATILDIAAQLAEWVETGEHDTADQPLPPFRRPEVDEVRAWLDAHAPIPGWSSVDSLKEALKVSEENRDLAEARLAQIEDLWKGRSVDNGQQSVAARDLRACLDWVPEAAPATWAGRDTCDDCRRGPCVCDDGPTSKAFVAELVTGFERVVTAQVPGGLLSEPEAPVAALPVVTPNDTPGSVDDPL